MTSFQQKSKKGESGGVYRDLFIFMHERKKNNAKKRNNLRQTRLLEYKKWYIHIHQSLIDRRARIVGYL